ncbi:MAG: hypothetical protein M1818_001827 [Claussenomyces sp. TS43310]|nr:MAG: hypothetical protein M1818_001827 [Claussenomyces sp. TS43310]
MREQPLREPYSPNFGSAIWEYGFSYHVIQLLSHPEGREDSFGEFNHARPDHTIPDIIEGRFKAPRPSQDFTWLPFSYSS